MLDRRRDLDTRGDDVGVGGAEKGSIRSGGIFSLLQSPPIVVDE